MEVFVWREIHITDSYEEIFYYTTYKIAYISVLVFRRLREFRLLIPINSKQNRRQRDLYSICSDLLVCSRFVFHLFYELTSKGRLF